MSRSVIEAASLHNFASGGRTGAEGDRRGKKKPISKPILGLAALKRLAELQIATQVVIVVVHINIIIPMACQGEVD